MAASGEADTPRTEAMKRDRSKIEGRVLLVCLDESPESRSAFWTACTDATEKDELLLLHVVPEGDEKAHEEGGAMLTDVAKMFEEMPKLHYKALMRMSNRPAHSILEVASDYQADTIYIGHHNSDKTGGIKWMIGKMTGVTIGSVASFVSHHCPEKANTVIVQNKLDLGFESEHVDKKFVTTLEEFERERRVAGGEEDPMDRQAALMRVVIDEETERAERMKNDRIISDRKHHVEGVDA
jgi:nucleotide-binding universal stress UspA family protein